MCLSKFINNNNSSKPWNRSRHFASFTAPKENRSLSLKGHHFNRITECALALFYHLDDIGKYLDKFTNVVNGMSILHRTFADMEIIKPIYAALGLLGTLILKPYHYLMMDKKTNYSTLIKVFLSLYNELKRRSASTMLSLEPCFNFEPHGIFQKSLPDKVIHDELMKCCKRYSHEVKQILQLSLKKFAYRFAYQKGAIIGFGEKLRLKLELFLRYQVCQIKKSM